MERRHACPIGTFGLVSPRRRLFPWARYEATKIRTCRAWSRPGREVTTVKLGVAVAVVSLIAKFLWLPVYPVWATITIDVLVVWALTAHGREIRVY